MYEPSLKEVRYEESNNQKGNSSRKNEKWEADDAFFTNEELENNSYYNGIPRGIFGQHTNKIASTLAINSIKTLNEYIQQNFGSFIPRAGQLKYYFKVSNMYVLQKIFLILFPYYKKNWNRVRNLNENNNQVGEEHYAPPTHDINAVDLYIPLMSFITYIILWVISQGVKGGFHPKLFGYLASQIMAISIVDIIIFKVSLYFLNCSQKTSIWDLIGFCGYKYVSIIVLFSSKKIIGRFWYMYYPLLFFIIANLSVFLMRSLKFLVLPSQNSGLSNTIATSSKQRKIRIQVLFFYSVILQGLIILFINR